MRRYDRLTLALPYVEEEPLCAELWAMGSLGMECRVADGETIVEAWFDSTGRDSSPGSFEPPAEWSARGVRLLYRSTVADEDWLKAYRASATPFEVGTRWLIDPGEPDGEPPALPGRTTLRLPARRAFGTGSHESTRLVLEWLEDLPVSGRRVLDLGAGTGVLSLAACRLGAASVVAVDSDPVAAFMARENRRLNHGTFDLVAGTLDCLARNEFELALVNIVPSAWIAGIARLAAVLAPGALALFSGLLAEQVSAFSAAVEPAGFRVDGRREDGEWVALLAERVVA